VARYQRWNALLDLLPGDGQLTVAEAARALGVSEATIRRDLDQLAKQQLVTRTRGGATAGHVSYDLPLRYKTARHGPEKQRIGRAAAALLTPGASVALNGGTTTSEVARALATRPDLQDGDGTPAVTVVTNAMNIANELAVRQHIKIVVTGGVTRGQSYELIGPLASLVLAELTLDWAILGVDALDPRTGATAHHEGEEHDKGKRVEQHASRGRPAGAEKQTPSLGQQLPAINGGRRTAKPNFQRPTFRGLIRTVAAVYDRRGPNRRS